MKRGEEKDSYKQANSFIEAKEKTGEKKEMLSKKKTFKYKYVKHCGGSQIVYSNLDTHDTGSKQRICIEIQPIQAQL